MQWTALRATAEPERLASGEPSLSFGSPGSFGAPGAGGSFGFADPQAQIGYAYVPNRKGVTLTGDPRDVALRNALYSATPAAAL